MEGLLLKWSQVAISALPHPLSKLPPHWWQSLDQSFATDQPMLCLPKWLVFHVYGNSFYEGLFHNESWDWLEADSFVVSQISCLGGGYVFVRFHSLRTWIILHDLSKVKQRDFAVLWPTFWPASDPSYQVP